VESELHRGSTFFVAFPVDEEDEEESRPHRAKALA
jgi:hypothetical protein